MEKNKGNNIVVLFIAISAFLLLIVGTSFAYFAANSNVTDAVNINVNIPSVNTIITTNSTQCDINMADSSMAQASNSLSNDVANSTCSLNITLSGLPGIYCSYDVVLKEESTVTNANYVPYVPTSGIGTDYTYEFTGTLTNSFSDSTGHNQITDSPYYNDGTNDITALNHEVQMDTLTSGLLFEEDDTASGGVLARGVIGINSENTPVTHSYTFTEKWYNLNKSQAGHKDKKYIYKLVAENIVC